MADDNAHLKSGPGTHIFRLKGLTTRVNLNQNANYAPYDVPPVNASYFMDISINSLLLDDLIFISAASNYIDNSKWPDISFSLGNINNSSKSDIDSYYVEHVTKNIGPAWLAKNITGGYNNSDIFHNEDELVEQYVNMDKSTNNLNYLKISAIDLSKKLALNKISIHDITSNSPVTLYSPDASGADFVTPGWVAGFDPSYALTTSDSEYLVYNTLDPSGVFIKYGFHTQTGHAYRIKTPFVDFSSLYPDINFPVASSENNQPSNDSQEFLIPEFVSKLKLKVYFSDNGGRSGMISIIDSDGNSVRQTFTKVITKLVPEMTNAQKAAVLTEEDINAYYNFDDAPIAGTSENVNVFVNYNVPGGYTNMHYAYQEAFIDVSNYKNQTITLQYDHASSSIGPQIGNYPIKGFWPKTSTELSTQGFTNLSGIFRGGPSGTSGNIAIEFVVDKTDFNSDINVSIIDSANNKPLYLHYDDLNENNIILDSSNVLQIHDNTNILDASTNIVFYDNSIKSQLIKNLKKGGTSEANPVSGSNLPQYYIGTTNLGREIMLSMFASSNEYTVQRINNVLTYKPPPIIYDVILGPGTKGDNSGNIVFYLNGVETPILHLTRGLNYEFNIDGTDISKNKFIFTKELKTDGVDICLNPVDDNIVITSGLTHEIDGYPISFNDFYLNYDDYVMNGILIYIDIRPLVETADVANIPLEIDTGAVNWSVSNVQLFNITTGSYVTLYAPDNSGNEYVAPWYNNSSNHAPSKALDYPDGTLNEKTATFLNYSTGNPGPIFVRYGALVSYGNSYRVHVSARGSNSNSAHVCNSNVNILDKDFNTILTVNPDSGFLVNNPSGHAALDATGEFSLPTIIADKRKIKWSVPFNEVNVPPNLFYGSDISDNLGGNIVINKNPIYGAMRFIDGDVIQFHLDYSQKAIVDASGIAIDSSGNKLGTNPIEEQDYIVRLNIHDLFNTPKFISKKPNYYNNYNIHYLLQSRQFTKSSGNMNTLPENFSPTNTPQLLGFSGPGQDSSFTASIKFSNFDPQAYTMILGLWRRAGQNHTGAAYSPEHRYFGLDTASYNPRGTQLFSINLGIGYMTTEGPVNSNTHVNYDISNNTFKINNSTPQIFTYTYNSNTRIMNFYIDGVELLLKNSSGTILSPITLTDEFYNQHGIWASDQSEQNWGGDLHSGFIIHDIVNPAEFELIHDTIENDTSGLGTRFAQSVIGTYDPSQLDNPISLYKYNLNTSQKYQFNHSSIDPRRNWEQWVTLDGSGIYLNNEASGNILGLQFATTSDEFGIGICSDICDNILGPAGDPIVIYNSVWALEDSGKNTLIYDSGTIDLTGYTGGTPPGSAAGGYELFDSTYPQPQQQDYINFLTDISNSTSKSFTIVITDITGTSGNLGIVTLGKRTGDNDGMNDLYISYGDSVGFRIGTNYNGERAAFDTQITLFTSYKSW